jgi:hypothetical protein
MNFTLVMASVTLWSVALTQGATALSAMIEKAWWKAAIMTVATFGCGVMATSVWRLA